MNHFFAYINRTKYIRRWGLMRNIEQETLSEHLYQTAVLAHALAVIENEMFGGCFNAEKIAVAALYHDASEIITGDMPTPVKYYSEEVRLAYKTVEENACKSLIDMLPEDFREDYSAMFLPEKGDEELWKLIKAADKISALIKCIEEKKAGNSEFVKAGEMLKSTIENIDLPEAKVFVEEFLPAYELTLDELK